MTKIECNCGEHRECSCRPVGDGTIAIEFTFFCENCKFIDKECVNVDEDNEAICPFCGQSSREHKETSKILWNMKACK